MSIEGCASPEAIKLPLPVLDEIPQGIYSLAVPSVANRLQVGFRGKADSFPRINVTVTEGVIGIRREDGQKMEIESPFVIEGNDGRKKTVRDSVLTRPVEEIILRKSGSGHKADKGLWLADPRVVQTESRVGLSRVAAKIGETIMSKHKIINK